MSKPPPGRFRRLIRTVGSFAKHYLPVIAIDAIFIWTGWPPPACTLAKILQKIFGGPPATCGA